MEERYAIRYVRRASILSAAFGIAAGVMLVMAPEKVENMIGIVLGFALFAVGIIHILMYFISQRKHTLLATDLFLGIILCAAGLWAFILGRRVFDSIAVIFGLLLIAGCFVKIQNSIAMMRLGFSNWWIAFLFGILSALFGVLIFLKPSFTVNIFTMLSGCFLIYDGVTAFVTILVFEIHYHGLKKRRKKEQEIYGTAEETQIPYTAEILSPDTPSVAPSSDMSEFMEEAGSAPVRPTDGNANPFQVTDAADNLDLPEDPSFDAHL